MQLPLIHILTFEGLQIKRPGSTGNIESVEPEGDTTTKCLQHSFLGRPQVQKGDMALLVGQCSERA